MENNSALWEQLRKGQKSALQAIYEQEFEYLFNYGRKVFAQIELVEDSIHDLFVEIWQRHESLGPTDSIRKYLTASLRRKIIAALKKSKKIENTETFDQITFDVELSIEELMASEEMSKEQSAKLKSAFEKLTTKQKEILYLRFYQGLDYDQIAEILDMKYQSLRNAVSRAIKNLRGEMLLLMLFFSQQINIHSDVF